MGSCSCVVQGLLHACALAVAVVAAREEKPSPEFHPAVLLVFFVASALFATDSCCAGDEAHLTLGAKRRHELLVHDGWCGCVPSRGRLQRVRRTFFNAVAATLVPLVVATRFLRLTHAGACAALFMTTLVVASHANAGCARVGYACGACTVAGAWLVQAVLHLSHTHVR